MDYWGVEPSIELSDFANKQNIRTYNGFFSKDSTDEIKKLIGKPDVMIFRHVLEHLDALEDIVVAIKDMIEDGLLLIEVPYLGRIVKEHQFYAFFHEHLSYYSVTALNNLLERGGLHIHRVFENDLEGGSILIAANSDPRKYPDDNVDKYLDNEKSELSKQALATFSEQIENNINKMVRAVSNGRANGYTIAGWGAGQRGCTLISLCKFQSDDIKYVIDVNGNYWSKYIPGTDIQIVPPKYYKNHKVDKIVIFATGYADSIIAENQDIAKRGTEFVRII